MFDLITNATPIQIYVAVLNTVGVAFIAITAITLIGYKRRVAERFAHINSDLDRILSEVIATEKVTVDAPRSNRRKV